MTAAPSSPSGEDLPQDALCASGAPDDAGLGFGALLDAVRARAGMEPRRQEDT